MKWLHTFPSSTKEDGASDPEIDGRAMAFRNYKFIEGAGHWVHRDQLAVFLKHVRDFLADASA